MKGPLFQKEVRRIREAMLPGERLGDVEKMYEIIVRARRKRANRGQEDEKIALITLCFFAWPGKRPAYRKSVRALREGFAGIAGNPALQESFRRSLGAALLTAASAEELVLERLNDIFDIDDENDDGGPGHPRRRPVDPLAAKSLQEARLSQQQPAQLRSESTK